MNRTESGNAPHFTCGDCYVYSIALGLRVYQQVEAGSFVYYPMAASVVALFSLLVLFFLAQRHITKGLFLTGTKG